MNMKSVQNINITSFQKHWVNMLISWVIECLSSWMPHRHTFRTFTHPAWAIWALGNHDVFLILPDPGRQNRITLSLESISTIPSQAGTSYVNNLEWGQHCSNRGMPCHLLILGTFRGAWNQPNKNAGMLFRCTVDIFSKFTNWEIQRPGMLIGWKFGQLSLVGCPNYWHNHPSSGKLILCILPPFTCFQLAVNSATILVHKVHQFKI